MPTSENLREWIACFVQAGSTLSEVVANPHSDERHRRDAERALEGLDILVREWKQGTLTPTGTVRSTVTRMTED